MRLEHTSHTPASIYISDEFLSESVCRLRTTVPVWIPPHRGEGDDFLAHIWSRRNSPAILSFSVVYSHSQHVRTIPCRPSRRGLSGAAIRSDCSLSKRETAEEPHPEERGDPFREKQQWLVWIRLTSEKAHRHTHCLICMTTMKQLSFCQVLVRLHTWYGMNWVACAVVLIRSEMECLCIASRPTDCRSIKVIKSILILSLSVKKLIKISHYNHAPFSSSYFLKSGKKSMHREDGYFPLHPSNSFSSTLHLRLARITFSYALPVSFSHILPFWPCLPWQLVLPICNFKQHSSREINLIPIASLHQISSNMAAKGPH